MASPEAEQMLGVLAQLSAGITTELTLAELRAAAESFGDLTGPADGVKSEVVEVAGLEAMWVVPEAAPAEAVFLYLHGGGLVSGSIHSYERLVGHLAAAAGVRALSVNYRLAPENQYPAALDDAVAAYESLLDDGFAPNRIAVAGDSSGAGLALAMLTRLRLGGRPLPAAVLAFSPNADATCSGETWTTNSNADLMLKRDSILGTWSAYLGDGAEATDPTISPVFADFTGCPPLLIQVGEAECLLDDSRKITERVSAAGGDVTLTVFPEMQHVFQLWAGRVPESDEAITQAGAFLRRHLA